MIRLLTLRISLSGAVAATLFATVAAAQTTDIGTLDPAAAERAF